MSDVIIIGGGPIGSIVGVLLARKGIDVLIIEKQKHPRWKPCGEGLSREGVEILKKNNLYSPVKNLFKNVNGISFSILDTCIAFREYDTPIAYTLDRAKFDQALFLYAKEMGAKVREIERVKNIITLEKVQVKTQHNIYKSDVVVGADGVNSIVGKKLYRNWASNEIGFTRVARYRLGNPPQTIKSDIMEYYFIEDGYAWIFPRREKKYLVLNIGVATIDSNKIQRLFDQFIATVESTKGIKLRGHEIDGKLWGHLLPKEGPCRGTYTNSTLLVGDAGGFVNPLTGGGLKYGTLSAIYAAETIIKFLNNEIESLETYKDKWQKSIKSIFDNSLELRKKLYFIGPSELLKKIQRYPRLKEQLLQSFTRETICENRSKIQSMVV